MMTENGMIDERYECAAEVMALRADNEHLQRELSEARDGIREVMNDHAETLERLDEAREWIAETGHRISCPWRHTKLTSTDLWPACDCGFIAILAATAPPAKEDP
jgi:hypothetical protein